MPVVDVTQNPSAPPADSDVAAGCAACPHPQASHDRISIRFCTATIAMKAPRGCVCTAYPEKVAP
jgi:hypothetical protein